MLIKWQHKDYGCNDMSPMCPRCHVCVTVAHHVGDFNSGVLVLTTHSAGPGSAGSKLTCLVLYGLPLT